MLLLHMMAKWCVHHQKVEPYDRATETSKETSRSNGGTSKREVHVPQRHNTRHGGFLIEEVVIATAWAHPRSSIQSPALY